MRNRSRGFTMIEILVALSLAGILIGGAFQIHAVFNVQSIRQKQVDDMQQSLRIAMQTIERTIRASGSGMVNGRMQIKTSCSGTPLDFFRVQYYNGPTVAAWPPPVNNGSNTGFDAATPNTSAGPDALRVVTASNQGDALGTNIAINTATVLSPVKLDSVVAVNDFALFVNTQIGTTKTAIGALRQLTAVGASSALGNNFTTAVTYAASGSPTCANSNTDSLMPLAGSQPVRFFRNETYFRIVPPATTLDTPKLSVAVVQLGTPITANTTWSMITDDIEDMQIALIMNDGRVCNDHDEPYPLFVPGVTAPAAFTSCDPSQAAAVRVTLTARTNTPSPGSTAQQSYLGGYEDFQPSVLATDGRLRRSLTSEMTLRN